MQVYVHTYIRNCINENNMFINSHNIAKVHYKMIVRYIACNTLVNSRVLCVCVCLYFQRMCTWIKKKQQREKLEYVRGL